MKENIEHHIEEEEGEMFKKARQVFDRQELEDLGDRMAERKTSRPAGARHPGHGAGTLSLNRERRPGQAGAAFMIGALRRSPTAPAGDGSLRSRSRLVSTIALALRRHGLGLRPAVGRD